MIDIIDGFTQPCSIGQRPGVHCKGRTRMDRGRRRKDCALEPGSPWENDYCESFNAKLRGEPLDQRIFCSPAEAAEDLTGAPALFRPLPGLGDQRAGGEYIRPPAFHRALMPRSICNALDCPRLRSKISA